jgi:hypothetical protein
MQTARAARGISLAMQLSSPVVTTGDNQDPDPADAFN